MEFCFLLARTCLRGSGDSFFMGTSSFLILTSYFLQYERDISQILSLTLNASSIRLRGEQEDTL